MASNLGAVYVELSLDDKVYKQKLSETLDGATATAKGIETAWRALGTRSDDIFDAQRRAAENAYTLIKTAGTSSANDIARAQQAASEKINAINVQQFGEQLSFIDKLKANWIAAAAAIGSAMVVLGKVHEYLEIGAKAEQAAESFRLVGTSAGYSAAQLEIFKQKMSEAAAGTVDDSDIMQKAVKGMVLGLNLDQMTNIMEAARISARVAGEDVKTAYEKITDAISTGMPKALRQYGLVTKEEAALVQAALKAGVQDINLYKIAMENAAIQAAKFGQVEDTVAEQLQRNAARRQAAAEGLGKFFNFLWQNSTSAITAQEDEIAEMLKLEKVSHDTSAAAMEDAALGLASLQRTKEATLEDLRAKTEAKKVIEETTKALDALRTVMQKYGDDALKMGKDSFGEALRAEKATVEDLTKGLQAYLGVIKDTYEARISGEKAVADAMAKSGATISAKEQLKEQAEIMKSEKDYLLTRYEAWKTYYDSLAIQHAKSTEQMKAKTAELAKIESEIAAQRRSNLEMQMSLQEKLMTAQGKASDDITIRTMKQKAAEELYQQAMNLTGEERIKALTAYQKAEAEMTSAASEYSTKRDIWTLKEITQKKEVVTQEQAIKQAMDNINTAQKLIEAEQEQMVSSKKKEIDATTQWKEGLEAAMKVAKAEMDAYTAKIQNLSKVISGMEKKIALTVETAQAEASIRAVKSLWDSLQSKTIQLTVNQSGGGSGGGVSYSGGDPYVRGGPSSTEPDSLSPDWSGSWGGEGGYGSHASGLYRVPFDDYRALLHKDEMVVPKPAAERLRGGGASTINFSPVININGVNKSGEDLADEIVRPLMRKMRQLDARMN